MLNQLYRLLVVLAIATLGACGGGGSAAPASEEEVVVDLGDTAFWPFDTQTAGVSPNTKFIGLNAILVGATLVPGRVGNAVQLNPALPESYAQIPIVPLGDIRVDFPENRVSIAMWARPTTINASSTYILMEGSTFGGQSLHFRIEAGKVAFLLDPPGNTGTQTLIVTSTTSLGTGTWTHVAVTFDGNVGRLYLNGAIDATNTRPLQVQPQINALFVGGRPANSGPTNIFPGAIDEVVLTQRTLTAPEVASLASGVPP